MRYGASCVPSSTWTVKQSQNEKPSVSPYLKNCRRIKRICGRVERVRCTGGIGWTCGQVRCDLAVGKSQLVVGESRMELRGIVNEGKSY
jgi:hypothetical protein